MYTKGPWELEAGRNIKTSSGEFYLAYGKDRYGNPLWRTNFAELDANARLIAAAPELLEACKAFMEDFACNYDGPTFDKARAAIAAAEGKA